MQSCLFAEAWAREVTRHTRVERQRAGASDAPAVQQQNTQPSIRHRKATGTLRVSSAFVRWIDSANSSGATCRTHRAERQVQYIMYDSLITVYCMLIYMYIWCRKQRELHCLTYLSCEFERIILAELVIEAKTAQEDSQDYWGYSNEIVYLLAN